MTTYTAICEPAGDWWEIMVPELPSGRVTQARKLADAEATVKDLVALMTDTDPTDVEVTVRTSEQIREQVREYAYAHGRPDLQAVADDPDRTPYELLMLLGALALFGSRGPESQTGT